MQLKLHARIEHLDTEKHKKKSVNLSLLFFLFLFQSRCASNASTAAIFRQYAGYVIIFFTRLVFKKNENFQYLGFVLHFICAHLGSYALLTVSLVLFGLK